MPPTFKSHFVGSGRARSPRPLVSRAAAAPVSSPFLVWMHPEVRGDLARFGQLDHVYRGRVAAFPARPAFQRGFELPDRGIPRPPDRIEGKAGASLTAIAFHFEPAETAVQALRDRGRRLRGPAVSFHSD